MSNIVECSRCHQLIISEAFESHICNVPTLDRETHEAVWDLKSLDSEGNETLFVKSREGILYTFNVMTRLAVTPDLQRLHKSPEDSTEPAGLFSKGNRISRLPHALEVTPFSLSTSFSSPRSDMITMIRIKIDGR